jgi:hypothetical protein
VRRVINGNDAPPVVGGISRIDGDSGQFGNWRATGTSISGTTSLIEYVTFQGRTCFKVTITNTASSSFVRQFSTIDQYAGSTVTVSALATGRMLETVPGATRNYITTANVYIESNTNMQVTVGSSAYRNDLTRVSTNGTATTAVGGWSKITYTRTSTSGSYIFPTVNITNVSGSGNSIVCYIADITFVREMPARTPISTPRTTATNRVATRDMGTALSFDGVDGTKVQLGTQITQLDYTKPFTVSVWVKSLETTTTSRNIFTQLFTNSLGKEAVFSIGLQGGSIRVRMQNRTDVIEFGSASSTAQVYQQMYGKWTHLGYSYNGSSGKLYINGVLQSGTTANTSTSTNSVAMIGSRNNSTSAWLGLIDEFIVYSSAFEAAGMQNLANNIPGSSPFASYLFNETTGTTALDSSGNGNSASITGATYTTDTPLRERTSV